MHICFLNLVFPDSKHHESQVEHNQGNGAGGEGVYCGIEKCHIQFYNRAETSQLRYLSKPSELSWQNVLVILSASQPAMPQLSQVNPAIIKIPKKHSAPPTYNNDETEQKC